MVTVMSAEPPHNINDHGSTTGIGLLTTFAGSIAQPGSNNLSGKGPLVLVIGPEHAATLGHMMAVAAPAVAKAEGLDDFRVVTNCGESASQTVFHLHLHVLGGRDFSWPPG